MADAESSRSATAGRNACRRFVVVIFRHDCGHGSRARGIAIESLDDPADDDAEQAWLAEAERRATEISSGSVVLQGVGSRS